ncbi:MAG: tRNA (guanosine(37)-N1)-methyltransferase TrmD [Candidatus Levybacteria bacterium]|nr:tRNA (guanosine(37)-N1)-methyltransferase TrmD [Candidatus Levybacteria bacterium]
MKITILTLFPEMFTCVFNSSIIKRAQEKKIITIELVNIRDFGIGKHKAVDDKPYGGGVGMIMRVDVLSKAIEYVKCKNCKEKVILLDPQGIKFNQKLAFDLSSMDHLIFVCGHYEGFDERVRELVDLEVSIGDYILTGGEIPAMVLTDAIMRLLPNVLGKDESNKYESFQQYENQSGKRGQILEYPQYTRPETFKNLKVPDILLSGNHQKIAGWRAKKALKKTGERRPDLLK